MLKITRATQPGKVVDSINALNSIQTDIKRLRRVQALKLNQMVLIDETGGVCQIAAIPDGLKVKIIEMLIDYKKSKLDEIMNKD